MNLRATAPEVRVGLNDTFFVFIKLPEDCSFVPKHVRAGAWYEVFLLCMFIVF
jgi:hypothetical protein